MLKLVNNNPSNQKNFFTRFKSSLAKTRKQFSDKLTNLILGKKDIDPELLNELETILLTADIGVDLTNDILQQLKKQVSTKDNPQTLITALQKNLTTLVASQAKPLQIPASNKPFLILMVGVNGTGKTTSIGKLANLLKSQGKSVMLAAGDTFRAAAVEQIQHWGEICQLPVISQQQGADSASVIFDAMQSAIAKNIDVLIADTAGRLHTQLNLMNELEKITRVVKKLDPESPHEIMLTIDASLGQNALSQAEKFHNSVQVSGLTITKLDGSAKGGVVFAIAKRLQIPIRYVGTGEKLEDFSEFNAEDFVNALFEDVTA